MTNASGLSRKREALVEGDLTPPPVDHLPPPDDVSSRHASGAVEAQVGHVLPLVWQRAVPAGSAVFPQSREWLV